MALSFDAKTATNILDYCQLSPYLDYCSYDIETIKVPLRKHAYSNILQILSPKNENFQIKNSDIFQVSAQNINCGYSLEPPR